MADYQQGGFFRDAATGAITVIGPAAGDVSTGRTLAQAEKTDANFTSVSTTYTDVTGMTSIGFTVPASGKVRARAYGIISNTGVNGFCAAKIVDNAGPTDVVISGVFQVAAANQELIWNPEKLVTGLTPGAAKTYKLQIASPFASATAQFHISSTNPLGLVITAA